MAHVVPAFAQDADSRSEAPAEAATAEKKPSADTAKAGESKAMALLDLAEGQEVVLSCDTTSIWLNTSPFKQSNGKIALKVRYTGQTEDYRTGQWTVESVEEGHEHSSLIRLREICKDGCFMRTGRPDPNAPPPKPGADGQPPFPTAAQRVKGQLELWAPNPMGLDELGDDEDLTLIAVQLPALNVKASMFRGRTPMGFEQGLCKVTSSASEKAARAEQAGTDKDASGGTAKQDSETSQ